MFTILENINNVKCKFMKSKDLNVYTLNVLYLPNFLLFFLHFFTPDFHIFCDL